jgi:putative PIN family toxin of toxin-antitoxin system
VIWAVLDTNTLVSGLGWSDTVPGKIVDHLLEGRFVLVTSRPLLDELARVLSYPKFKGAFEDPVALALLIETVAVLVEPRATIQVVADDDDNRVLEAALEGHADYIVTGDRDLLEVESFEGTEIVTPKQFLSLLEAGESPKQFE